MLEQLILLFITIIFFISACIVAIDKNELILEVQRLRKIIKKQNKEIKKLKNLGGYIYDNYMKKEND